MEPGDCYKPVFWAAENSMAVGNIFLPGYPCTRAEAVEFIWLQSGSPASSRELLSLALSARQRPHGLCHRRRGPVAGLQTLPHVSTDTLLLFRLEAADLVVLRGVAADGAENIHVVVGPLLSVLKLKQAGGPDEKDIALVFGDDLDLLLCSGFTALLI